MKISVLVENSVCSTSDLAVKPEHGLSLHIEVNGLKILFDVGKSDLFARNAKEMGIDLTEVDFLFISHGHYDHGGGLKHFLEINKKAKIYMHEHANNKHYAKLLGFIPLYIGLNSKIVEKNIDRIQFINKDELITDDMILLEGFKHDFPLPKGNLSLYEKNDKKLVHDHFKHEILLLLKEKGKNVVLTACSHSGIINMMEKSNEVLNGEKINAVFGGLHTYNPATRKNEDKLYLDNLASEMEKSNSVFYTGHCTGEKNFLYLKEKLGDSIKSMNTGEVIII